MSYIGKQPTKAPLTASDIEDGIITAAKIEDGAVVAAEIASNAVTTAKINADAVTSAKIADNAINSEHYTDGSIDTAHIADANVTTAKIAADAITAAKINDDIISGATELASEPADTDEFLVSDAGTLKRIDYSLIKGGGITQADQWRVTANTTNDGSNEVTANWERCDNSFSPIGTGMSESSGVFSFPTTGIYHVTWHTMALGNGGARAYMGNDIRYTTNNSSYTNMASAYGNAYADQAYGGGTSFFMFDVTNVSTHKLKFRYISSGSAIFEGNTDRNWQVATFIRLGDT